MKTYTVKGDYTDRKWLIINAEGQVLGRMASRIASILRGKHKPIYSPYLDLGDFVIVINAEKLRITGRKGEQKVYYRHSGYPGGLKTVTLNKLMEKKPERILEKAVKGMLPHNKLGRQMYRKLKVYKGSEHPHQAQKPEKLELKK
ncbi:50S ribosomal protein L13 [candidate division KSB1 bacterium]